MARFDLTDDLLTLIAARCAGWFIDGSGQTFFALRYAEKPTEFAKGKNAIAAG